MENVMENKEGIEVFKPVQKMTKDLWTTLLGYSLVHGIVDMAAGAVVFASLIAHGYTVWEFFILVVLYNFLSFGLQWLFGLMIDKYQVPREATIFSILLVLAAYFVFYDPILVVLLAGIGDSLFHVGAGSISLNFTHRKTLPAGIFVAPGGIGLLLGILIGKGQFGPWVIAALISALVGCVIFVFLRKIPKINYIRVNTRPKIKLYWLIIFLLFTSVAIRSLYGLTAGFEWKDTVWMALALVTGIVMGKALGGFFADRFGWTKTAVTSLIIAAPLLVFCKDVWFLAILGSMIFQMTMPITLVSFNTIFEGRSAFAFGFACLALMVGATPIYLGAETLKPFFRQDTVTFVVIGFSAIAIYTSLRLLRSYFKGELKINM